MQVVMLSKVHIASYGLFIGIAGPLILFADLLPRIPVWIIAVVLLPPWLTVYTISFCRQPPCGPRRFRQCLVFAMCWYAGMILIAEALHFLMKPLSRGHFPHTVARLLALLGALTFIVFVRVCVQLRRYESETTS